MLHIMRFVFVVDKFSYPGMLVPFILVDLTSFRNLLGIIGIGRSQNVFD